MECSINGPAKDYQPEIRLDFYYGKKSKDFRLLMNLLAESSGGLAQSFRILCVFDKHFQKLWKIQDFKVISKKPTVYFSEDGDYIVQNNCETRSAWVLWNDAAMATYMTRKIPKRPIGKFFNRVENFADSPEIKIGSCNVKKYLSHPSEVSISIGIG